MELEAKVRARNVGSGDWIVEYLKLGLWRDCNVLVVTRYEV